MMGPHITSADDQLHKVAETYRLCQCQKSTLQVQYACSPPLKYREDDILSPEHKI